MVFWFPPSRALSIRDSGRVASSLGAVIRGPGGLLATSVTLIERNILFQVDQSLLKTALSRSVDLSIIGLRLTFYSI